MATTKAFELAQLSALTEVDGSGATIPVNFISSGLDLTNSIAPYITFTEGSNQTFLGIDGGRFWIRQSGIGGGDEFSINTDGTSEFNHAVTIADTTTSTSSATGSLIVSGGAGIAENLNVGGDLTVTGDFTVDGTTVALNTTDLNVEDKNITLNYHATADTSASADGAGITIQDAVDASNDASIIWDQSDSEFDVSHSMKIAGSVGVNNIVTNKVVKFNGTILDDSNIIDTGTKITLGSDTWATGAVVSTSGITSPGSPGTYVYNASAFDYAVGGMRAWSWGSSSARGTYSFIQLKEDGDNQQTALFIDTVGRVGINSTNPTYGLQINNAKTTNDGTLYVNAQLNGSGDGVVINSNTRTTNDNADLLLKVIDRGNNVALSTTVSGRVGVGTDNPVTALHVDPGYVTLGTSTGTDNSWINNVEDGNLELVNEGRSTNDGAVRINRKNNPAGDTTYFRDTVIYDGKSNVVLFVDGSEGKVGIGTDSPDSKLTVNTTTTGDGIELQSSEVSIAKLSRHVVGSTVVASLDGVAGRPIHIGGAINEKVILGYAGGNVGIATDTPSAFLHVKRDNNNSGNQFQVADPEGTTAGVRTYTTSDGTGIIMNHYYAKSGGGNKYLRHADIVSNMADGAAADFRFFTKDQDSNPRVAMSLSATGAIHTGDQQVRHNLQPALSLDFANSRAIDNRIQYAREGVATYFDRNGVMKYAQNNEPRIDYDPDTGECKGLLVEEERTNWMTYPNEFGFSQWALPGLTAFQNAGLAPDGTMSADLLIPDTSYTGRHFGYKVTPGAFLSGLTYNISCYFKAYGGFSESCKLGYRVDSDTQSGDLYGSGFQIANGEPAGNGWYRHSLTVAVGTNASLNFAEFILGDQNGYTPTGGKGVYLWGFSVEKAVNNTGATFPTSFIPTIQRFKTRASTSATYTRSDGVITTAGQHQARYDHGLVDGVWRSKGLLLEAAATNLSQNFYYPASTLKWNSGVQNATITPDVTILAPDGTYNNVVRFKETTSNASTTASVYKPISGTANTQRCFSVYAKKKELKMMRLYFDGTTPVCGQVIYNLDLGTIHIAQSPGNTDAWGIEDAGNGWWRCWFSGTVTGGQSTYYIHVDSADDFGNVSHQNTVGNGFYLWGPQMEYGGAPTSYIYTDDSAATRALDQCDAEADTRYGDDIKIHDLSWYNSQESTIYGEGTSISANNDTGSNPALWGLTDGTSSNRYLLRRFSNDATNDPTYGGYTFRLQQTMPDGTSYNNDFFSPTADGLGEWDDSNVHKMAMSISPGNQIGAADGRDAQITSVTTMPAYTQPTMVQIGYAGSSDYWNGHIRKLAYYPTQLNISEMKALTETDT